MDKLILIPFFVTLVLLYKKGAGWTYTYWWIPMMLACPVYFEMDGPGFPPLTFYIMCFAPFFLCKELWTSILVYRHWMDCFVYLYILAQIVSEFHTTGFNSARQLLFLSTISLVGPYMGIKYLILHERRENQMAVVFVTVMAAIAIFSLYEFRFGLNPFLRLRSYWPYYYDASNIVTIPRWGFFRASGPFVHPIIAGIIYGFALPMTFWIARLRLLGNYWKGIALIGFCLMGLVMSFSRGPMLGAIVASLLYLMGKSRHRIAIFSAMVMVVMLLSIPVTMKVAEYMSVEREQAQSSTQETVLYRKELIENYLTLIEDKPWLGYGFLNIPYVPGQRSIDNAYILFALNWGVLAVLAILGLGLGSCLALVPLGLDSRVEVTQRSIVWAIIGGLAGCMASMATVYLATPCITIYFMWAGWAAGLRLRKQHGLINEVDIGIGAETIPIGGLGKAASPAAAAPRHTQKRMRIL